MKAVISMGGSILASPEPNVEYIKQIAKLLLRLKKEGHDLKVVVGGGEVARRYIRAARELGADEEYCDKFGIIATRMNAMLLRAALGIRRTVPKDFKKACNSKLFVMGGVKPGQTTDAVAAGVAAQCKADLLINATNVDGVYDSDPKQNPAAKKFEKISSEKLLEIVGQSHKAGLKTVMDPVAAGIIHENKIKTVVVDGRKIENIENAVKGIFEGGTLIF